MELRHDMLTHGVNIVTAHHEGRRAGLAVAWATQVGAERVLLCIGSHSATRELILGSKAFGVSVLRADQLDISRAFGTRSSLDVDKFEGLACHTAETGSPLLDDCGAAFDCIVANVYDVDDWLKLIVGRIVAAEFVSENYKPLVYRSDDY